jgi:hypothetical protein
MGKGFHSAAIVGFTFVVVSHHSFFDITPDVIKWNTETTRRQAASKTHDERKTRAEGTCPTNCISCNHPDSQDFASATVIFPQDILTLYSH